MADQNVYDDPVFFANYKKLRENEGSANACVEQPAMFSLCPPVQGLSVLDLGCGSGEACRAFAEMGAARVVGLDLSENMLAEPMPDAATVRRFPKYAKYRHKPDFLLMRVKK